MSVQERIENALSDLHSKEKIEIVGCGRTDTGVHAYDYFCHVDLPETTDIEILHTKLNRMLPSSILIAHIEEKAADWHARFDAKKRTYRYFVSTQKDPFQQDTSWFYTRPFDLDKMNEACQYVLGRQDFTSFSKLHTDVKTNFCTVHSAEWFQTSEHTYYFEISADRFLRNMVRATVGTLMDVGIGKIAPEEIKTILADLQVLG